MENSSTPRIVYRYPTVPPTLVRTDAENTSFCSHFTPPAVCDEGVGGHPEGDAKAAKEEVFPKMSESSQEVAEKLEEVNEAVQELRGKRSQFYNPQTEKWVKRDKETGQIMEADDEPYKAVPRED